MISPTRRSSWFGPDALYGTTTCPIFHPAADRHSVMHTSVRMQGLNHNRSQSRTRKRLNTEKLFPQQSLLSSRYEKLRVPLSLYNMITKGTPRQ
eukprot:2678042-Rhodomonas_salina.2